MSRDCRTESQQSSCAAHVLTALPIAVFRPISDFDLNRIPCSDSTLGRNQLPLVPLFIGFVDSFLIQNKAVDRPASRIEADDLTAVINADGLSCGCSRDIDGGEGSFVQDEAMLYPAEDIGSPQCSCLRNEAKFSGPVLHRVLAVVLASPSAPVHGEFVLMRQSGNRYSSRQVSALGLRCAKRTAVVR